ncbi:MAG TPA: hypothetical protein VGI82_10220 [Chitinophagaceae bacterium]
MSEDYHSFFIEKKGDGKNKEVSLNSFLDWDAPLHPDIIISTYSVHGDEWKVEFHEQNNFSKLIGYPGWKGKEIIRFDSRKKIVETIYIPNDNNPGYKPWLQPAVDWLRINRPLELDKVYKNGKLVQTAEAAKKWTTLLRLWKNETAQKK